MFLGTFRRIIVNTGGGFSCSKQSSSVLFHIVTFLLVLSRTSLRPDCLFTHQPDWGENCVFMCFRAVSSNVNNGEVRRAVISDPHPLAFTTGKGSRDVRKTVSSGWGQLPLLRLITLGPGCQRCVCVWVRGEMVLWLTGGDLKRASWMVNLF